MRESVIEKYLVEEVSKIGGVAEKFTSPNRRGVPDRLILFPKGVLFFVEVKSCGKVPTKIQLRDHQKRRNMGFEVFVVDSKKSVDEFIRGIVNGRVEKD
jgi:hypothetical protein